MEKHTFCVKKTLFSVVAILMLLLCVLIGCAPVEKGRTDGIPVDGIVSRQAFAALSGKEDIGVFNGESNAITYQWLFWGSKIQNPKDENLLVQFSNSQTQKVKEQLQAVWVQEFSFAATALPEGEPSLSVHLPQAWATEQAAVYRWNGQTAELVCSAALENAPNAILTFVPKSTTGLFFLVGEQAEAGKPPEGTSTEGKHPDGVEAAQNGSDAAARPLNGEESESEGATIPADDYLTQSPKAPVSGALQAGKPAVTQRAPARVERDNYLSQGGAGGGVVDKSQTLTCTLTVRCDTILSNLSSLDPDKKELVPSDGVLFAEKTCDFYPGESVFDLLTRELKGAKVHLEYNYTPIYNSAYIEGIGNLYQFDCGPLSGWMYQVNGWFPNYGSSRYPLAEGDVIDWVYTCDLGRDVGGQEAGSQK